MRGPSLETADGRESGRSARLSKSASRIPRPTLEGLAWVMVFLGVALRIAEYADFRRLYLDEVSLLKSLQGRAVFDFSQVLVEEQMAPPGFLVVERLLVRLPWEVEATARLFPLLCGLISMFLVHAVSRRYLDPRAVPLAVALFAMGHVLLYYSAETKQYSCDLMLSLAALLLAAPAPPAVLSRDRFRALVVFGMVAPWFSFTVVFPLAVVGLQLIGSAIRKGDRRGTVLLLATGLAWVVSFSGCYVLSRSTLSRGSFIWEWWDFAFLPLPPRSLADLSRLGLALANAFINPGGILTPLPPPYTAGLAAACWLAGLVSLGRRWPGGLWILAGPIVLALAASALRLYPFHGRLLIYLTPAFLMPMAEGVAAIGRRGGWRWSLLLASLFVLGEAGDVVWHRAIQRRARSFDSHGDLRPDLLDHLERQYPKPPSQRTDH
ncbi:MAG: glycosyltransferase family 39 protein [Isosphaeraceae bacterium]